MEINFSKPRLLSIAAALILITAAVVFALRFMPALFSPETGMDLEAANRQPALQALNTIYAPAGEKAEWEQSICGNMTAHGCEIFKSYYAAPIWQSGVQGADTHVTAIRASLEDGSQVWQAETNLDGKAQSIYIHVEQREDGQWVLARILFEEEARKYEK